MRRRTVLFAPAALLGCATPPPPVGDQSAPQDVEIARGSIGEQAGALLTTAAAAGFSGAAMIEINGELVFAGGYGWADREARRPFTIDTIAQLGSITKTFTGAALADLVGRGLVDIDQPAGRYLPNAAEPGASVPLRQLLCHRSGMSEYCGDDYDRRTAAEVRSVCMAAPLDQPMNSASGSAYSNTGYSVLAAIVEQVSGQSLERYVASRLLTPAGINEDGYALNRRHRTRLAAGYDANGRHEPISVTLAPMQGDYWNLKGNGGMQLSARAMHRWHMALTCRAPLDSSIRDRVVRPVVGAAGDVEENNGTRVSYGYGWAFRTTPNGTPFKLTHGGSDGIFLAQYLWRPYDRVFLYIVGSNGEDAVRPTTVALRRLIGDAVRVTDQDLDGRPDPWVCQR